jgi:glycosyltransferase involved in cell wall biosynthesis
MKTESKPLVSVIVPSYNQGQFIEDTINSILKQDYPHIEVIVMDGGSSDGTLTVLKRHAKHIAYFSARDKGQSEAINKGFRMAKGEIVTWLNSDDLYPDRRNISIIVEAFTRHTEYDLIYGNFIEIDVNNCVLKIYKRPTYSHKRLLRIGYISQPATFFRRCVIDKMSVCEDLQYAMDLEYWLRAHSLNFKFKHINFVSAAERLHETAKCVRDNSKMAVEAQAVRLDYGACFNRMYPIYRFADRFLLYLLRLPGILDLISYRKEPDRLTIPLTFDGAIMRTLLFRSL